MVDIYEVSNSSVLAVGLDGNFARRMRATEIGYEDWKHLRKESLELVSGGRIELVRDSCLVSSVGLDANSSSSLYMDPRQCTFFSNDDYLNKDIPSVFGEKKGQVIYVSHNVDGNFQREGLLELFRNWVSFAKSI